MRSREHGFNGVVVDEPQGRALLYQAIKEKLVDDDLSIGNGFVKRILENPPLADVRDSAYEQLILGGKVYVPFRIPDQWKGEILEKEVISSIPYINDENRIDVESINTSLILFMLRARGINWTESQLQGMVIDFYEKVREFEAVSDGINFDSMFVLVAIAGLDPNSSKTLTPVRMKKWEEANLAYQQVKPVIDVIESYKKVITSSLNLSALSALPVFSDGKEIIEIQDVDDTLQRQAILKITSKELKRTPIGYDLAQTLEISASSEAESYRSKLTEWVTALRNNSVNSLEKIHSDVRKSRKELNYSKALSSAGGFCTCIGFSTLLASPLFPPIAALGGAATVLGVFCFGGEKALKFRNQWAMFGKE